MQNVFYDGFRCRVSVSVQIIMSMESPHKTQHVHILYIQVLDILIISQVSLFKPERQFKDVYCESMETITNKKMARE